MGEDSDEWSVLIPVKRLAIAKTRLALDATARRRLALAMAADTVSAAMAASAVREVVIVTDDAEVTATLAQLGARVVADRPDAGINPALRYGAVVATTPRIAALAADLPTLRPADLDLVLELAGPHLVSTVSDIAGTGTTMLAATERGAFAPAFGPASRSAHLATGAFDLSPSAPVSIRHDVDTRDALRHAVELGLGPATTIALGELAELEL
jgi:2-phospho-L-lactate/phosphoenolpyruvate guanylyltransferase